LNFCNAIALGIVQGLTEFLPVSSSGHLVIVQSFIPAFRQPGVLFDVMLHFGTLIAVVFFLFGDISALVSAFFPRTMSHLSDEDRSRKKKTVYLIVIGTIVTGAIGLASKNLLYDLFHSARAAAAMLLVTGLLLYIADRVTGADRAEGDMTTGDALIIGIAQAVALIPGISRSGATISTGMLRHIEGETAARFSFLLSIPAIVGATILELRHLTDLTENDLFAYCAGTATAALIGFLTLKILFYIIKRRQLRYFAYYCWVAGAITLAAKTFSW